MKTFKLIYVAVMLCLTSLASYGQSHHDINKLDNEIELLLDTAAKHMINFILTQKEAEYNTAIEKATKAEELNATLAEKVKKEKGVAGKVEEGILEDRKDEFKSYKNEGIKTAILNEKSADRKVKVKFKGQSYLLSQKSKVLFDEFHAYLPAN